MGEKHIDVSVLMLTYFHENYIAQALDSILAQKTNLSYEIIIGDDASGDRTQEIVLEYAKKYSEIIKPVLRSKNIGAMKNSEDITRRAKGKYIAYLEGDDYWLDKDKMQKQFDFLEANPEYSACCGKCLIVDETGRPDYTQSTHFADNKKVFTLEDHLKTWNLASQVGSLMRRRDFGDDYFDSYAIHPIVGDKTQMLILLSHGPIYCTHEILSAYRRVTVKDGKNYFSQHYSNPYRHYDMFMYPCRLETWAKKRLGLDPKVRLGPRRDYRFCRFVEQTVRKPSLKNLSCLIQMIFASHQPVKYILMVFKAIIEMEL